VLCQRVESAHAFIKGGWFHFYESARPEYVPRTNERQSPKSINAAGMIREWQNKTTGAALSMLAIQLGVSSHSVITIGAAWCDERNAWAFPMKDSEGTTIGIRLRSQSGFKWAIPGSQGGLFIPNTFIGGNPRAVFIPEGPTSTAALVSLGFNTIGRPSANSGFDLLKKAVKIFGFYEAVIVADNDDLKKMGPYEKKRVGIESAKKLKAELGMRSCIWIPPSPCKDARDFVKAGGTAMMVEQDLRNKIWTKK
jgi:hypothetical protein